MSSGLGVEVYRGVGVSSEEECRLIWEGGAGDRTKGDGGWELRWSEGRMEGVVGESGMAGRERSRRAGRGREDGDAAMRRDLRKKKFTVAK